MEIIQKIFKPERKEPPLGDEQKKQRQVRLKEFIEAQGGSIPFDVFMGESLYGLSGEKGYYQKRVVIGDEEGLKSDFITYSSNPLFVELVFRHVLPVLGRIDRSRFVELGGGTGVFKKHFIDLAQKEGIPLDYLSIDLSSKLIRMQKEQGGENIQASVLNLPLRDGAVKGIIFMNELVDALPYKIVGVRKEGYVFKGFEELYYSLNDQGKIEVRWLPASSEINVYWERQQIFLRKIGFDSDWDIEDGKIFSFNLNEERLLRELDRVLAEGEIIIIDYGGTVNRLISYEDHGKKGRKLPRHLKINPEEVFKRAYTTDITYDVNFTNLMEVAEGLGLEITTYTTQRRFLFDQVTPEEEAVIGTARSPWPKKHLDVLRKKSEGDWHVLVLKKTKE